jgi:hypothetical protein
MPEALTAYIPHIIGLAAMGYLIARWLRSWRRKRSGNGPACGGGCPSCEASRPSPRMRGGEDEEPAATPTASAEGTRAETFVPLRLNRRG